ncbi:MAG: NAD(P)H-quinone oxidoreductase [Pseudomonadota bacterium]
MTETMWAVLHDKDAPLRVGEADKPVPGPKDVLVRIHATGLNRADLVQRAGFYPPPPGASEILGLECAGEVVECGAAVTDWKTGDRVCALLAGGGYAEYTTVDEGSLFAMPEEMSFNQAAALPEVMMTVWANIFDRCAIQAGEQLLIHGGTSGIGTMAIQMAKVAGVGKIMVTAGTAEKCAAAKALGADVAINYRDEDFEAVVAEQGGADVVLDMVGGDYVQKNISVARINGRICNIAYLQGHKASLNLMPIMLKRLILTGTTLRARPVEEKRRIRDAVLKDFWPAVLDGRIQPVIDTVYTYEDADKAHAQLNAGGHVGKVLLSRSAD